MRNVGFLVTSLIISIIILDGNHIIGIAADEDDSLAGSFLSGTYILHTFTLIHIPSIAAA